MESTIFIKFEIIIMLISLWYIVFFLTEKIYAMYFNVKKIISPKTQTTKIKRGKKVNISWKNKSIKIVIKKLTSLEKEKLCDIVKRAKANSSKWYFDSAKHLIVEWLAIDKYNKDLNLELAAMYEKEQKYKNAEFIYKDLIDSIWKDVNVMKKLAFIYALQHNLNDSLIIYEKVLKKKKDDSEVLNMLCDITFELHQYEKALKYVKVVLKDKPRNIDRLSMQAVCFEHLENFKEAFDVYKRIVELQPYNTLARNKLNELFVLKK